MCFFVGCLSPATESLLKRKPQGLTVGWDFDYIKTDVTELGNLRLLVIFRVIVVPLEMEVPDLDAAKKSREISVLFCRVPKPCHGIPA